MTRYQCLLWVLLAASALAIGCTTTPAKPPPQTPSEWIALPRPK